MSKYTTNGPVRGRCGHEHRTIDTAFRCLAADQSSCRRAGGYSDRCIVRTDGESLTDGEFCAIEDADWRHHAKT